ncbi:bifunctional adenosylcobinamide kinase/adenosylcobinamide-phosphate guanylyltransferase [Oceanicoccus sp. KOV_DT_Chl]|uniref:bifunctional adenosylcobinamide kinase/adenosylcobinamide-phosphate guanylyltransferase n=1 Tax=Oceanicoccus sp. KOV_DT_Chl TaxID=1904639 RepID=UPI000C797E1D|nr:bifunctional adenosylcobinamide kinase/adenosylcobinamide-phosphate guanylyltransferase [Oceanicoccus sp. KOV_DT_Chl]
MKQLILGGARSGKSKLAEQLASRSGKQVIYIATADRKHNDREMDQRISHHQQSRPAHWQTIEAPHQLATTLTTHADNDSCLLVDCLTLWLSNCLCSEDQNCWHQEQQHLLDTLATLPGDIILVSNEVGHGVVPLGEINRRFVDESGFLHQAIAALADRVVFTAAGLPLVLKGDALNG